MITVVKVRGVGKVMCWHVFLKRLLKPRDITGGLPRVAGPFEARVPKDAGMLAEITGTVSFGKGNQRQTASDYYRRDGVASKR